MQELRAGGAQVLLLVEARLQDGHQVSLGRLFFFSQGLLLGLQNLEVENLLLNFYGVFAFERVAFIHYEVQRASEGPYVDFACEFNFLEDEFGGRVVYMAAEIVAL